MAMIFSDLHRLSIDQHHSPSSLSAVIDNNVNLPLVEKSKDLISSRALRSATGLGEFVPMNFEIIAEMERIAELKLVNRSKHVNHFEDLEQIFSAKIPKLSKQNKN